MFIIYVLILGLLIINLNSFGKSFFKNGFNNSNNHKYLSLHNFVEPIIRVFNSFNYLKMKHYRK